MKDLWVTEPAAAAATYCGCYLYSAAAVTDAEWAAFAIYYRCYLYFAVAAVAATRATPELATENKPLPLQFWQEGTLGNGRSFLVEYFSDLFMTDATILSFFLSAFNV